MSSPPYPDGPDQGAAALCMLGPPPRALTSAYPRGACASQNVGTAPGEANVGGSGQSRERQLERRGYAIPSVCLGRVALGGAAGPPRPGAHGVDRQVGRCTPVPECEVCVSVPRAVATARAGRAKENLILMFWM